VTRRRRGSVIEWPPELATFRAEDWPQPASGPDPGAKGLRAPDGGGDADCEQWLAALLERTGDPGLAGAWRASFAWERFAQARLDFLGEDHPRYMDCWLDWMGSSHRFVREYVAERDRLKQDGPREW
jgi:hypothetical protein